VKRGVQISDLAGSWKMSDKECEEMLASIESAWNSDAARRVLERLDNPPDLGVVNGGLPRREVYRDLGKT